MSNKDKEYGPQPKHDEPSRPVDPSYGVKKGGKSPCCGADWIPPSPDAPDYLENVTTCPDCGKQYTAEQLKAEAAKPEPHADAKAKKPDAHS
jgi:hypothetical protein